MIVCPTCRAALVQVRAMPDSAGQWICGCVRMIWVYRTSGALERVQVPARSQPQVMLEVQQPKG
jgi:hypothetical protein